MIARSRKPRNDKFLRKQESFFSGGSDKFFETIKEKLYEILGGKVCSNCGFSDERALGISPISENVTSMIILDVGVMLPHGANIFQHQMC